jgi:hypothetical protein
LYSEDVVFIRNILWGAFALTLLSAPLGAAITYGSSALGELAGSRIEGSGIVTTGDWDNADEEETIEWLIAPLGGGLWSYTYTFLNFVQPAISHFILDLTDDCVDPGDTGCVVNPEYDPGKLELGAYDKDGKVGGKDKDKDGKSSNPGFPDDAEIIGIKFDFGNDGTVIYTFVSNRGPVYGDFYVKGGSESGAYNFGLPDHLIQDNVTAFIARPNGAGEIPEPASVVAVGTGLIAVVALRRRWQRRHSKR